MNHEPGTPNNIPDEVNRVIVKFSTNNGDQFTGVSVGEKGQLLTSYRRLLMQIVL